MLIRYSDSYKQMLLVYLKRNTWNGDDKLNLQVTYIIIVK
jgi:hypothetical protein